MRQIVQTLLGLSALVAVTTGAGAQTLYSNGPVNGNVDAWVINYGDKVTDSFSLSRLRTHCLSQKSIVAAIAIAAMKVWAHRS